jgi:hypothetical protein
MRSITDGGIKSILSQTQRYGKGSMGSIMIEDGEEALEEMAMQTNSIQ